MEEEGTKLHSNIPETTRQKELELNSEERRLANFIEFIGEKRGNQALGKALQETERKVEALQKELNGLHLSRDKTVQASPIEWIKAGLALLGDVLEQNTAQSAQALRHVLGPKKGEPTYPEIGKPNYVAHGSIIALAIIEPMLNSKSMDNGSNLCQWWARKERIRTFAEIPFQIDFHQLGKRSLYQELAATALHLTQLA